VQAQSHEHTHRHTPSCDAHMHACTRAHTPPHVCTVGAGPADGVRRAERGMGTTGHVAADRRKRTGGDKRRGTARAEDWAKSCVRQRQPERKDL
jgi:hypothetical protein